MIEAWVGGEHRSIHFRTGALGQGSRTALPIYGYFMEKVVKDPAFVKYQAKFPTKPKQDIARTYNCRQYSSVNTDSMDYMMEGDSLMMLEGGNAELPTEDIIEQPIQQPEIK